MQRFPHAQTFFCLCISRHTLNTAHTALNISSMLAAALNPDFYIPHHCTVDQRVSHENIHQFLKWQIPCFRPRIGHVSRSFGRISIFLHVTFSPVQLTFISPLVSGSVVKLKIYLPVLPGLSSVFAVVGCFVSFVIYFCTESMSELFCTAPSLLAKEMLFTEVFTEVFVITGRRKTNFLALGHADVRNIYL